MRRHDLDLAALVFGLVFRTVGLTYAAASLTDEEVRANIVVPAALVGLGLAGMAAAIRAAIRAGRPDPQPSVPEEPLRTS